MCLCIRLVKLTCEDNGEREREKEKEKESEKREKGRE